MLGDDKMKRITLYKGFIIISNGYKQVIMKNAEIVTTITDTLEGEKILVEKRSKTSHNF